MNQFQWPNSPGNFGGPGRRTGLRVTGPAGVIVLIIAIAIAVVIFAKAHNAMTPDPSGPCIGGPVQGATGEPVGNGNYKFPCEDGGSTIVHLGG
ncbi:MAG TPA: hypothetical protein VF506_07615 [Streptosporangiaceae bacterium]